MTVTPLHRQDLSVVPNPPSGAAHAAAFRAVLLYTVTDCFDLVEDEILWAGYRLDELLGPLAEQRPTSVPLPVRMEMLEGAYTRMLTARVTTTTVQPALEAVAAVRQAGLDPWVDVLSTPIVAAYDVDLSEQGRLRSGLRELLVALGVGDATHPRPANHLPGELLTLMQRGA